MLSPSHGYSRKLTSTTYFSGSKRNWDSGWKNTENKGKYLRTIYFILTELYKSPKYLSSFNRCLIQTKVGIEINEYFEIKFSFK